MGHNVSCVLEPALPDSLYECLQDECIKSDVKRGCKRTDPAAASYNTRLRDGLDTRFTSALDFIGTIFVRRPALQ